MLMGMVGVDPFIYTCGNHVTSVMPMSTLSDSARLYPVTLCFICLCSTCGCIVLGYIPCAFPKHLFETEWVLRTPGWFPTKLAENARTQPELSAGGLFIFGLLSLFSVWILCVVEWQSGGIWLAGDSGFIWQKVQVMLILFTVGHYRSVWDAGFSVLHYFLVSKSFHSCWSKVNW